MALKPRFEVRRKEDLQVKKVVPAPLQTNRNPENDPVDRALTSTTPVVLRLNLRRVLYFKVENPTACFVARAQKNKSLSSEKLDRATIRPTEFERRQPHGRKHPRPAPHGHTRSRAGSPHARARTRASAPVTGVSCQERSWFVGGVDPRFGGVRGLAAQADASFQEKNNETMMHKKTIRMCTKTYTVIETHPLFDLNWWHCRKNLEANDSFRLRYPFDLYES